MKSILATVAAVAIMAGNASANITFNDAFTGGPCSQWQNPADAVYTDNNAKFPPETWTQRKYLCTVDANYGTEDFVATMILTPNIDIGFFGLGGGVPAGGFYKEPSDGVFMRIWPDAWNIADVTDRTGAPDKVVTFTGFQLPANTPCHVTLTWVARTGTATFGLVANSTDYGTVSMVVPSLALPGAISRLFFGGAHGLTGDNFSVIVPEPSALVLLTSSLLGLLAYAWRKQR